MEPQTHEPTANDSRRLAAPRNEWQNTLAAMTLMLQGCLQNGRATPSPEIDRAEKALHEYVRREKRQRGLAVTTP